jgi:YHS domain-containing protein
MKKFFVLVIVILAVALVFGCGKKKEEAAKPEQAQPAQVEETTGQITCVVCGMAVDTTQVKIMMDYEGKTYYFCSEEDKAKFEADPDEYLKKEEEGAEEAKEKEGEMH